MNFRKIISCVAGAACGIVALAIPSSAATGSQSFTQVMRATLTPSGPVVTFSQATAGGLISGIGAVSIDGAFTIRTLRPRGVGTFSLGATATRVFIPVANGCETVVRTSGNFEIVMGSGTGAFAGAKEDGTFNLQETIVNDRMSNGKCAATGHLYLSLQASGIIKTP